MREYRFLAPALLHLAGKWIDVSRFGQAVSLSDEDVRLAVHSRCTFLTTEAFNSLGFTPDELRRYANISSHGKASQEFLDKKDRAVEAARAEMAAVAIPEEVPPING